MIYSILLFYHAYVLILFSEGINIQNVSFFHFHFMSQTNPTPLFHASASSALCRTRSGNANTGRDTSAFLNELVDFNSLPLQDLRLFG